MTRLLHYRAILNRLKNVAWLEKTPCDVLIYDAVGSDEIHHCIPARAKVNILNTREGLPLIKSARFILIFLSSLIKYREPGLALVVSILRIWKPKVVITFIDNTVALGVLKRIFPDKQMISVQNGSRWDVSLPNRTRLEFDQYFSFGVAEIDIFSKAGHSAAHVHPVGSLRAGIFAQTYPSRAEKEFDLCFISHFSGAITDAPVRGRHEQKAIFHETGARLFRVLADFSEKTNLRLCIAMRYPVDSPKYEDECRYYSVEGHDAHVRHLPRVAFSSYKAVRASKLSVALSSTLAYEALGFGERVILGSDIEAIASIVVGEGTQNLVTHKLPELQRLYSLDYDEFSYKAVGLLGMTDEEYMNYSRDARAYYMNIDPQRPPHEIIKQSIEKFLCRDESAVTHRDI